MTRSRIIFVVAAVAALVLAIAAPAGADPVQGIYDKFFGCDGYLQFPCPGPMP